MVEFSYAEKEKFNMGMGYFGRCNELLTFIQNSKMQGDKTNWYIGLYCLYSELHCKFNKQQKEDVEKLFHELCNRMSGDAKRIPDSELLYFELKLRQVMEDKNMLSPKGEDPGRAIMSGGL